MELDSGKIHVKRRVIKPRARRPWTASEYDLPLFQMSANQKNGMPCNDKFGMECPRLKEGEMEKMVQCSPKSVGRGRARSVQKMRRPGNNVDGGEHIPYSTIRLKSAVKCLEYELDTGDRPKIEGSQVPLPSSDEQSPERSYSPSDLVEMVQGWNISNKDQERESNNLDPSFPSSIFGGSSKRSSFEAGFQSAPENPFPKHRCSHSPSDISKIATRRSDLPRKYGSTNLIAISDLFSAKETCKSSEKHSIIREDSPSESKYLNKCYMDNPAEWKSVFYKRPVEQREINFPHCRHSESEREKKQTQSDEYQGIDGNWRTRAHCKFCSDYIRKGPTEAMIKQQNCYIQSMEGRVAVIEQEKQELQDLNKQLQVQIDSLRRLASIKDAGHGLTSRHKASIEIIRSAIHPDTSPQQIREIEAYEEGGSLSAKARRHRFDESKRFLKPKQNIKQVMQQMSINNYRDFILELACSPLSRRRPLNWDRLCKNYPSICIDKPLRFFTPPFGSLSSSPSACSNQRRHRAEIDSASSYSGHEIDTLGNDRFF